MTLERKVDVVIFGGGVAGFWTLNDLISNGYSAILVENTALGNGQTIACQGIIHGGSKYDFTADLRMDSSQEVRRMPQRWREHLNGSRTPDLSKVTVSSENCYFWISKNATAAFLQAIAARAGMTILNTPSIKLDEINFPAALSGSAKVVYSADEPVIYLPSLLKELAIPCTRRILYANESPEFQDESRTIIFNRDGLVLHTEVIVLTAGLGNLELAERAGITGRIMQRKPTRHLYAIGNLPEIYGHCLDGFINPRQFGPYVSITTHGKTCSRVIWNIGGDFGKPHLEDCDAEFIAHGAKAVARSVPGINLKNVQWGCFNVYRAEGFNDGERPAGVSIHYDTAHNIIVGWPTKLALAPVLSEEILKRIQKITKPSGNNEVFLQETDLRIAKQPWDS